ncbi:MAG: type II/IV secretion system protein, partial [Simkaniaceae bacterium]|nr:type II/IV secretion system protein [Simkaniaceae bacterium]
MTSSGKKTLVKDKQADLLANRFGMPTVYDLSEYPFVKEKIKKLPYAFVKSKQVLPLDEIDGKLLIALANPLDLEVLQEIRCLARQEIEEVFCPKSMLEEAIEKCYHQGEEETSQYIADLNKDSEHLGEEQSEQEYDLLSQKSPSPVIRMLNMILIEAIQQGASDIHFEPIETGMSVRYRIDGVLQFRHSPPREFQQEIITRIKVLAKLDIAEHRLPQDGRIKLNMTGRQIDFRASTVPIVYGERIVLRILDMNNVVLGLDKIGMEKKLLKKFKKNISENQGIVLVTGPTGSGKTTTLYSAISEINASEINIMTVEDPIEYKLNGIAQIGVNPKINLTFAKGLRHILRQDPDVVLIGEIRDKETAEIAIQ